MGTKCALLPHDIMQKCREITRVYAGDTGKLVVMAYVAGFATAINVASGGTDDVFSGTSTDDMAAKVMIYCRENPSEIGVQAITAVLPKKT